MNSLPLIRAKGSNEQTMAILLVVLVLYHLPFWMADPFGIVSFLLLVLSGFLIDGVISILRYKRLWCCVSAGITAAIISLLTQGIPLWCQLMGITVALLIGKHSFGGTGKNPVNPAMVGLLTILLFQEISFPFSEAGYLILPAMILSLAFLPVRPYAGCGFLIGTGLILFLQGDLSLPTIIAKGILFWGCLIVTDPVTITYRPISGLLLGFATGVALMFINGQPLFFVIAILVLNLVSYVFNLQNHKLQRPLKASLHLPKAVSSIPEGFLDLTGEANPKVVNNIDIGSLSREVILNRIRQQEVFGMGGAAFTTVQKLEAVIKSQENTKALILNGIECDPGLIHDRYLLRNFNEEIVKGVEILKRCVNFNSVHLAVKDTTDLSFPEDIKLHKVKDRYPIGAERLLIKEVLNTLIEKEQLPADRGILVLNVQTVYAIYQAVLQERKADTRLITVADMKAGTAWVVKVRLGMKLHDIKEQVYPGAFQIYAGGGAMQAYPAEEDAVLDRTVNFIAVGTLPKFKESPQCSGCGQCIRHCPAGLSVNRIADLIDEGREKETTKYHPNQCLLCGSCSYICKAGKNLAARMKLAKEATSL